MRIGPHKQVNSSKRERTWLAIGLSLLILLLVWLLLPVRIDFSALRSSTVIRCGAEHVQNTVFVNDGHHFEGVQYQSRLRSRSGRQSVQLPADGQTHFAFTTVLEPLPGQVYEIKIWSYDNLQGDGKLAVQGRDPGGFYQETVAAAQVDEKGWTLHQLRVVIPFQNPPSKLAVYVYNTGLEAIFFDDLSIELITESSSDLFQPTRLELDINTQQWTKLEQKRSDALRAGLLVTDEDDWVNARLRDGNWEREIKLRLKGDWLDHLRGDKWSFRIKLKAADSWRGLKTFSLHTPEARYYLHEWLLHQYWTELGVLTTDYDFVELVINGESRGIYAYEEHFEKQLLESRDRREGPIVKFAEEGFWAGIQRQLQHHGFVRSSSGLSAENPANAQVSAFNQAELAADTALAPLLTEALLRLQSYQDGSATVDKVFDLPVLARYYAACDLLNAYHGIVWHNQRFYYNPVTTKLEPIGFDGYAEKPARRYHFLAEGRLERRASESTSLPAYFLQDSLFMSTYIGVLKELSEEAKWKSFTEDNLPAITARQQYLSAEFPNYELNLDELKAGVAFVRSHLLPFSENCLRAREVPGGRVALENTHTLPMLVVGFSSYADQITTRQTPPTWLPAGPVRALYQKLRTSQESIAFRSIDFWNDQAMAFQEVNASKTLDVPRNTRYVFVQPAGLDTVLAIPLRISPAAEDGRMIGNDAFRVASSAADFPSLVWDETKKVIHIPAGEHEFSQDLVIPKNHTLSIAAGAKIDLCCNAAIIAYGPVYANGEAELPVELFSSDGKGQGLQVLQVPTTSILNNVLFKGLRNLRKERWQLTGAVTFYESSVEIESCRFLDNKSEDALNIVRSEFRMNRSLIQNTSSDGLDADFCKGTIKNSAFVNTSNDGVDFSGSIITLSDVRMESCGDKGLSAGEASDITLIDAEIQDCIIGLASKDQSTLHARRLSLSNCQQGLVAFQKKPEYGPAYLLVEQLQVENINRLYQIAPGSRLQIDDELIFE